MGRPPKAAPVFLIILDHIYGYSLYIPYIFHIYIYFLDMFHCHPCIFPCVFLDLWSQEKINPYRKTTFALFKISSFTTFILLLMMLWFFIKIHDFLSKVGPIWAHKGLFTQVFFKGVVVSFVFYMLQCVWKNKKMRNLRLSQQSGIS